MANDRERFPWVSRMAVLMRQELAANADKGDPGSWRYLAASELVLETYRHVAKLDAAVRDYALKQDPKDSRAALLRIAEHAADVANQAMFIADKFNMLPALTPDEADATGRVVEAITPVQSRPAAYDGSTWRDSY